MAALSFARRNERQYGWGDDPRSLWQRIDWGFVLACAVAFLATGVTVYVALRRAG